MARQTDCVRHGLPGQDRCLAPVVRFKFTVSISNPIVTTGLVPVVHGSAALLGQAWTLATRARVTIQGEGTA